VINAGALDYMPHQGLPKASIALLESHSGSFADPAVWEKHLAALDITDSRPVSIATEGALYRLPAYDVC
jgi:hypothetical protein